MNNESSGMGIVIGVVVVILILIVGFIAYKQGYFSGQNQYNSQNNPPANGVQVQVGGTSSGGTGGSSSGSGY